jgi:hypothetical protein
MRNSPKMLTLYLFIMSNLTQGRNTKVKYFLKNFSKNLCVGCENNGKVGSGSNKNHSLSLKCTKGSGSGSV